MERLDKLISVSLGITRSQARKLIKSGVVSINGSIIKSAEAKANPQEVKVNGKAIEYNEYVYIMLNKPQGVVSASEGKGDTTVIDILPEQMKRKNLFPAGRLDKDTLGFVLITDDGAFAHNILSPARHIEKTYEVRVDGEVTEELIEKFASGITLYDGTELMSAELSVIEAGENPLCKIKIKEGKYHQIKRMFASNGLRVTYLKRTKMGALPLDESLGEGEARYLTKEELDLIINK